MFELSVHEGGVLHCLGESELATIEAEFLVGIKGHGRPQPVNATLSRGMGVSIFSWDLETRPWEKYCGALNFFVRYKSS